MIKVTGKHQNVLNVREPGPSSPVAGDDDDTTTTSRLRTSVVIFPGIQYVYVRGLRGQLHRFICVVENVLSIISVNIPA